jgi:hypothetical protein
MPGKEVIGFCGSSPVTVPLSRKRPVENNKAVASAPQQLLRFLRPSSSEISFLTSQYLTGVQKIQNEDPFKKVTGTVLERFSYVRTVKLHSPPATKRGDMSAARARA